MQNRQNDGGWAIPYRTVGKEELKNRYSNPHSKNLPPLSPDKTKPSSHLVTGMALRALSISPTWKSKSETLEAARWLTTRFFQEDYYEDRSRGWFRRELVEPGTYLVIMQVNDKTYKRKAIIPGRISWSVGPKTHIIK